MIISDGLMYGDGIPFNEAEKALMEEGLQQHEPAGIAWTAEEFQVRARAHHEQVREREFDELMSSLELEARQSREGERLPEGYHRGVLAGLSADERRAMVKIDRAFGLGLDVSESGNWAATDRKTWLDEDDEFEVKVGDEMEEYEREQYLALRDRVRRRIKEMGKDISRSEVVDDIIASIKKEMLSGKDFKEIEAMAEQFAAEAETIYRSQVISR
jgi:hypothetical protein